jgi:hypothetical protein
LPLSIEVWGGRDHRKKNNKKTKQKTGRLNWKIVFLHSLERRGRHNTAAVAKNKQEKTMDQQVPLDKEFSCDV